MVHLNHRRRHILALCHRPHREAWRRNALLRCEIEQQIGFAGHTLGVTARYIDGYNDDSELTIEERNLPGIDKIETATGEAIPSWLVFDALYGFAFGSDDWKGRFTVGVLNLLDEPPPAVQGPLGYEVGVHDPRGRVLYARVAGEF